MAQILFGKLNYIVITIYLLRADHIIDTLSLYFSV